MNLDEKKHDIIDTTDCLEAVSAFKAMKNFLFIIALICLLTLEAIFWINDLGYIDKTGCPGNDVQAVRPVLCPLAAVSDEAAKAGTEARAAQAVVDDEISEQAKKATGQNTESADMEQTPAEIAQAPVDAKKNLLSKIPRPRCADVAYIIRACNFILIVTGLLYSLTLLMTLKISLSGRLGGINHISRAFLVSLVAVVFLLPWQCCFRGVALGAIYTPKELLCRAVSLADTTLIEQMLYYTRFTGMFIVVFVLLCSAQYRSARWSRATMRRLGIIH